jgi:hypothetical protein
VHQDALLHVWLDEGRVVEGEVQVHHLSAKGLDEDGAPQLRGQSLEEAIVGDGLSDERLARWRRCKVVFALRR